MECSKNIKYLFFDLDDTLLRKNRTISDYTISILKKAQEKGFKIIFNTSRSMQNSKRYIDIIHPDYGIYSGGCHIVDKDGNPMFVNMIDKKDVKEITKFLFPRCEKISVQTYSHFYASDKEYKAQNAIWYDFTNGLEEDAFKIICCTPDLNFVKDVAKKYNLELQNYLNGSWNRLSIKGATKWNGVLKFLEIVGGNVDETSCFGDDIGDEEMIQKSCLGVAMKNSQPQVLANAKNITIYSNDEDGVAHFIEKNLL